MTTQLKAVPTARKPHHAHDEDDDKADADAGATDITRWEPLTLAALLDYKTYLRAPGDGQFKLVHVQLWPVR